MLVGAVNMLLGGTPFSGKYLSTSSGTSAASFSFTMSFDPADSTRMLVAAVMTTGSTTVTSCSIGGVSATKIVETTAAVSGHNQTASIFAAMVPTGTSGTVAVAYGGVSQQGCAVSLYLIYGRSNTTPFGQNSTTGTSSITTSLSVPAGGFAIACSDVNSSSGTVTWSAGWTKDYGAVVNAQYSSSASKSTPTATTQSVTATIATSDLSPLVVASWGPN